MSIYVVVGFYYYNKFSIYVIFVYAYGYIYIVVL